MSSRPLMGPFQVITNGNMASPSITSHVTIVQMMTMISYDISWAGSSPVGLIVAQISNTYSENADGTVRNAGNWTNIPLTLAAVTGNTGVGFIEVPDNTSYAIRLQYTATSGTGTMQAFVKGKVS